MGTSHCQHLLQQPYVTVDAYTELDATLRVSGGICTGCGDSPQPAQTRLTCAHHRNLHIGGALGFAAITICVFLFGFGGILAAWSGLFVPSGPDDYGNTILFSLLDNVNGGR